MLAIFSAVPKREKFAAASTHTITGVFSNRLVIAVSPRVISGGGAAGLVGGNRSSLLRLQENIKTEQISRISI
ncbi:hypothetical protein [Mucilaginibacter rigui]|uniref:hypothetical protein n=1 Tax=Mucilaginibacter rigui TaxID=534635 RepID=UPI001CD1569B|nr:hypothetical protein [Mucilaginibacter rigui]